MISVPSVTFIGNGSSMNNQLLSLSLLLLNVVTLHMSYDAPGFSYHGLGVTFINRSRKIFAKTRLWIDIPLLLHWS